MENQPPPNSSRTQIIVSLVVALVLIAALLPWLIRPSLNSSNSLSKTLMNLKQVQMAARNMAVDNQGKSSEVEWTCSRDKPLTLARWKELLIAGGYISESDLAKYMSCERDHRYWFNDEIPHAVAVYAVTEADPENTLLLATKNWHGPGRELSGEPYGDAGCVAFRKGGEGTILTKRQAEADPTALGGGGQYKYTRLK